MNNSFVPLWANSAARGAQPVSPGHGELSSRESGPGPAAGGREALSHTRRGRERRGEWKGGGRKGWGKEMIVDDV